MRTRLTCGQDDDDDDDEDEESNDDDDDNEEFALMQTGDAKIR